MCTNSTRVASHLTSLSIKTAIDYLRRIIYFSQFKACFWWLKSLWRLSSLFILPVFMSTIEGKICHLSRLSIKTANVCRSLESEFWANEIHTHRYVKSKATKWIQKTITKEREYSQSLLIIFMLSYGDLNLINRYGYFFTLFFFYFGFRFEKILTL